MKKSDFNIDHSKFTVCFNEEQHDFIIIEHSDAEVLDKIVKDHSFPKTIPDEITIEGIPLSFATKTGEFYLRTDLKFNYKVNSVSYVWLKNE